MTITIDKAKAIADKHPEGFVVYDRGEFDVAGYLHNGAYHHTDGDHGPDLLEMRFSKFDKDGNMICLPMEKFFNYGDGLTEKFRGEIDQDVDNWSLMPKEDGSLINFVVLDKGINAMTKMGLSEVADDLAGWMAGWMSGADTLKLEEVSKEITANWEYCAPTNRIVLDYKKPKLKLLSGRNMKTGKYLSQEKLFVKFNFLSKYDEVEFVEETPVKELFPHVTTLDELSEHVSGMEEIEGFILTHKSGKMRFKMKTEWYLERHGLVGVRFNFENIVKHRARALLQLIVNDDYDDVLPHVTDQSLIDLFEVRLNQYMTWRAGLMSDLVDHLAEAVKLDVPTYAKTLKAEAPFGITGPVFQLLRGDRDVDLVAYADAAINKHMEHRVNIAWTVEEAEKFWNEEIGDWD